MWNKIKLFIYIIIGVGFPFLIRTTLFSYTIRNINLPYTTIYLHSLDLVLFLIFAHLFWQTKRFPLSSQKIVDKLWITLLLWIFFQLIWAKYPLISWFWGLRVYLLVGITWYIRSFKPFQKEISYIAKGFIIGMLGQALIVITQVWFQSNTGLPVVVEPTLSPEIAGVAKVSILDNVIIRGYGTFPHPNILAFAGVLALILLYAKEFKKKLAIWVYIVSLVFLGFVDHYILTSIQALVLSLFTGLQLISSKNIEFSQILRQIFIFILHIIIILSFSKIALALLLFLDFIYLTIVYKKSMFHVEQFQNKLKSLPRLIINSIAIAGILFLWILPYKQILETIVKRGVYIQDAANMIYANLWLGVGLGQYVGNLSDNREIWQYEPVHNIFLLLLSEIGAIGVFILVVIFSIECYTKRYGYKK